MSKKNLDYKGCPIEYAVKENKWYFWDETWTEEFGPYNTKEEVMKACEEYCKTLGQ